MKLVQVDCLRCTNGLPHLHILELTACAALTWLLSFLYVGVYRCPVPTERGGLV